MQRTHGFLADMRDQDSKAALEYIWKFSVQYEDISSRLLRRFTHKQLCDVPEALVDMYLHSTRPDAVYSPHRMLSNFFDR